MILWTWGADGPDGSTSGVTDDEASAKHAAVKGMLAWGAATATVEAVMLLDGVVSLEPGYRRTGTVWIARRDTNGITWRMSSRPRVVYQVREVELLKPHTGPVRR